MDFHDTHVLLTQPKIVCRQMFVAGYPFSGTGSEFRSMFQSVVKPLRRGNDGYPSRQFLQGFLNQAGYRILASAKIKYPISCSTTTGFLDVSEVLNHVPAAEPHTFLACHWSFRLIRETVRLPKSYSGHAERQ